MTVLATQVHQRCPFCGSAELSHAHTRGDDRTIARCESCGLLFLREVPEDLGVFYGADYFKKARPDDALVGYGDYDRSSPVDFRWQLSVLRLFAAPGRLIDVGCASGKFLLLARDAGFTASGVELIESAAAAARSYGFPIVSAPFEAADLEGPVDAVSAWELIEHVRDLRAVLAKAHELLADGGCFLFSTPDVGSESVRSRGEQWIGFRSSLEHLTYLTHPFLARAIGETFGSQPLLWSFDHGGELSTTIGLARKGGLTAGDLELGRTIARRESPDDADRAVELGWLYLQLKQHDALARLLATLPPDSGELLRAAALLTDGRAAEAVAAFESLSQTAATSWQHAHWLVRAHRELGAKIWRDLGGSTGPLRERITRLEDENAGCRAELTRLTEELERRGSEAARLRRQLDELRTDHAGLTERADKVLASASFRIGRALTTVLERAPLAGPVWSGLELLQRGGVLGAARAAGARLRERVFPHPAASPPPAPILPPRLAGEVAGLVSVVLPVYNQSHLLAVSIQSVLQQTYDHFELIVVNDGSKDGISAVLEQFVSDPRVRILTQHNQGLPKALSNGFDLARGQYWTWTSADNLMEPDQLATLVDFLRRRPDVGMTYADYLAIDDAGRPLADPSFRPHNRRAPDSPEIHLPEDTRQLTTIQDNFIGPCFLYRGLLGRLLGEYDPIMGIEDYDYWMRIADCSTIAHVDTDRLLYRYRVHDNSLSGRAAELRILDRVQALMVYEAERVEFYRRPWTLFADRALAARVTALAPELAVREWQSGLAPAVEDKCLWFVTPESLPKIDFAALPARACVVVWLDSDLSAPYRHRVELPRADLCLTTDEAVGARLRQFVPRAVIAGEPSRLREPLFQFANNHLFYRLTRSPAQRRRHPAEVFLPGGRKRRVLLQVDDFMQGGMEQVVLYVAEALVADGFEVVLSILGRTSHSTETLRAQGIELHTLPADGRAEAYRRLVETIDIVNAHYSIYGAEICAELGVPFVQTIHNTYVWFSAEQIEAYRLKDPHTTAYLCVSACVAFYSDARLGLSVDKLLVAENGVDGARFGALPRAEREPLRKKHGIAAGDFVFLNVASILETKAQRQIVYAMAQVVRRHPRAKVLLVGRVMDPLYAEQVRKLIDELHLGDSVIFAGHQSDVTPYLVAADAFLLPSFWEGGSLALAEALHAGLPVVATDVGSARELLSETGGELVPLPFSSIAEVHGEALRRVIDSRGAYVDDLAAAMSRVCAAPKKPVVSSALKHRLERKVAYRAYGRLFRWLLAGGDPAAARHWLAAHAIAESQS